MNYQIRVVLLLSSSLILTSCASYTIQPISQAKAAWPTEKSTADEGYIFYQPELYFAATITTEGSKDKDGKETAKETINVAPLYLPNYTKPYRVTTFNFLAKADFAFDFENGWKLTKLADKSDNSTVANTLAGELKTVLSAAGLSVASGTKPKTQVILYRPKFDAGTGYFNGFDQVGVIDMSDAGK